MIIKVEDGDTGLMVTATVNGKTGPQVEVARVDTNHPEKGWKVTVINAIGYTMPSTGGPGTRYYSVLGVLLTALSAGFFLLHRRRH